MWFSWFATILDAILDFSVRHHVCQFMPAFLKKHYWPRRTFWYIACLVIPVARVTARNKGLLRQSHPTRYMYTIYYSMYNIYRRRPLRWRVKSPHAGEHLLKQFIEVNENQKNFLHMHLHFSQIYQTESDKSSQNARLSFFSGHYSETICMTVQS